MGRNILLLMLATGIVMADEPAPRLTGADLARALEGVHAVIVRSSTKITRESLQYADTLEVIGRAAGAEPAARDEVYDYQGPQHKMTVTLIVPSAEKAYEDGLFREKNIPGGLRHDEQGDLIFETHDPDGVKIIFRQAHDAAEPR